MAGTVEEVALVVAQAEVRDAVQIQRTHLTQTDGLRVRVPAGRPFSIRFAYRVYEESMNEDQWVFRLTGRIGDGGEAISEMRHKDRLLVRDEVWAHLSQEHLCPTPGEYQLRFVAHAALQRRRWGETAPHDDVDQQSVGGTLIVEAV